MEADTIEFLTQSIAAVRGEFKGSAMPMDMPTVETFEYHRAISDICEVDWSSLTEKEVVQVAWAYYFFSIQFRENLKLARELFPDDADLLRLEREECNTDNLSPWPGVADTGEKLNHGPIHAASSHP